MKCEDRFCPCCYASEHIRDYMDAEHEKALRAGRKARRRQMRDLMKESRATREAPAQ